MNQRAAPKWPPVSPVANTFQPGLVKEQVDFFDVPSANLTHWWLAFRLGKAGNAAPEQDADGSSSFAQRMMQKMGWKEGLGLGKSHQGITTHLEHKKTDRAVAVIRHAAPKANEAIDDGPPEKKARGVVVQGDPSRVVLLRNIVGPGQSMPS